MKTHFLFFCILALPGLLSAQVIGNRAYDQDYTPAGGSSQAQALAPTDSTFLIQARVMLHSPADVYLATFNISQLEESPQQGHTEINRRLTAFTDGLKELGVREEDIFVDLIAQSKVYDFEVEQNRATEYLKGFKVQKNIIVRCDSHDLIARMLNLAAEHQIYELVAVEYISTREGEIYNRLFEAAAEVVGKKRDAWIQLTGAEIKKGARPYRENFYSIPPENRYRSYEAKDAAQVYNSSWERQYLVKRAPREQTFFYDIPEQSGFDKVLNPAPVEVGLAYVLELQVEYKLR